MPWLYAQIMYMYSGACTMHYIMQKKKRLKIVFLTFRGIFKTIFFYMQERRNVFSCFCWSLMEAEKNMQYRMHEWFEFYSEGTR